MKYQAEENGESVRNNHGKVVRWRCTSCKLRALYRRDELESTQENKVVQKNNPSS